MRACVRACARVCAIRAGLFLCAYSSQLQCFEKHMALQYDTLLGMLPPDCAEANCVYLHAHLIAIVL